MVEVQIFGSYFDYWVVEYMGYMYVMLEHELFFEGGKVYTYPNKLIQRYHVIQSNKIW